MVEGKRKKDAESCFVNIKSTDIVASLKIVYSILLVPLLIILTDIAVLLVFIFALKFSIGFSFLYSTIFSIVYPLYLYLCVFVYDFFMYNGRMMLIWVKLYCCCSDRRGIRELRRMRKSLKGKIIALIKEYRDLISYKDPLERLLKDVENGSGEEEVKETKEDTISKDE